MPRKRPAARTDDFTNTIQRCDALDLAARLPDASCDLIYIDPPFGTDSRRASQTGQSFNDSWQDGLKGYLRFLQPHLAEFHRLLAPHGTLWLHLDWRAVHYAKIQLDTIFEPQNFMNEIIWHYRTGGLSTRWFGRKHDTILVYAKQLGRHRFHSLRGGEYRTDGLNFDGNRPYKMTRKGRLYFNPEGPALTDVWDIPFLSTVSLERTGWPTQKPLALLDRIIRATTNEGDCVADFFCGSGTTLAAAKALNRRWIGCDKSAAAVRIAKNRLKGAKHATMD